MELNTPGPWGRNIKPASHYPIVYAGRNTHIAQVITQGLTEAEAEANCNLIAAAPELLEMLRQLSTECDGENLGTVRAPTWATLRAVETLLHRLK